MFSLIEHLLPLTLSLFKGSFGCCGWDVPGFRYLHVLTVLGTAQPCSPQVGGGVPTSSALCPLWWSRSLLVDFFPHPPVDRARIGVPAPQGASPVPTLPPSLAQIWCLQREGDPEGTIPSTPAQSCLHAFQNTSPNSFQRMCGVISRWVNCQVN